MSDNIKNNALEGKMETDDDGDQENVYVARRPVVNRVARKSTGGWPRFIVREGKRARAEDKKNMCGKKPATLLKDVAFKRNSVFLRDSTNASNGIPIDAVPEERDPVSAMDAENDGPSCSGAISQPGPYVPNQFDQRNQFEQPLNQCEQPVLYDQPRCEEKYPKFLGSYRGRGIVRHYKIIPGQIMADRDASPERELIPDDEV